MLKNMVATIKKLNEDEIMRMKMEAREDYERRERGMFDAGKAEGHIEGKLEGAKQSILSLRSFNIPEASIARELATRFGLSEKEIAELM